MKTIDKVSLWVNIVSSIINGIIFVVSGHWINFGSSILSAFIALMVFLSNVDNPQGT